MNSFVLEQLIYLAFNCNRLNNHFNECDFDDDDDDEDDDGEQSSSSASDNGKDESLSDDNENKCQCSEGCSTQSCSCFKSGGGCNSSCGCSATCQNMFNHLDYFFGENHHLTAHPCFASWLIKRTNNQNGFQAIDRDKLRRRIVKCAKKSDYLDDDENFSEWLEDWKKIKDDGKLAHTQKLFQLFLSNDSTQIYYSLCNNEFYDEDCYWHCEKCHHCVGWRAWHCNR